MRLHNPAEAERQLAAAGHARVDATVPAAAAYVRGLEALDVGDTAGAVNDNGALRGVVRRPDMLAATNRATMALPETDDRPGNTGVGSTLTGTALRDHFGLASTPNS